MKPLNLPLPLSLDASELEASAYATALSAACGPILHMPLTSAHEVAETLARIWLTQLGRIEYDPMKRQELFERSGQDVRDDEVATRAIMLWRRIEEWHAAEKTRNPRYALRELMSELSEDTYCAAWHYDTEYCLWELLTGARAAWVGLGENDPRLAELRRLHEAVDGWWWWNPKLDGGWGRKEFLLTEDWEQLYALTVDDKERTLFAVIDGKILRGEAAVAATAKLLRPHLNKSQP